MTWKNVSNNYCYCWEAPAAGYVTAFYADMAELRAAIFIVDYFRRMYHFDR